MQYGFMKNYICLLLLLLLILSCVGGSNRQPEIKDAYGLELSEDKTFSLDAETVQKTDMIQLFEQSDTLFFSFSNSYDNSIVIYDYTSGDFVSKIRVHSSVIILDAAFNVVGETLLPDFEYLILHTFVSPDGLHVQVLSDDDDRMRFKTFKVVQK